MLAPTITQGLDGIISAASAPADAPWDALAERTAPDAAEKVRFLYEEIKSRMETRQRTVESLLTTECQVDTRLYQVLRWSGWFNEVGEKERLLLYQELRDLDKERRRLYEGGFEELHNLRLAFVEAMQEYRMLHRRGSFLTETAGEPNGEYSFPALPQYLACAMTINVRPRPRVP